MVSEALSAPCLPLGCCCYCFLWARLRTTRILESTATESWAPAPEPVCPRTLPLNHRASATCFTVPGDCLSSQVVVCPGGQFYPFMERVRQWLGRAPRVSVKGVSRPECEKDTTSHSGPQPGLSADVECSVLSLAGFDLSHCAGDCTARNCPPPPLNWGIVNSEGQQ